MLITEWCSLVGHIHCGAHFFFSLHRLLQQIRQLLRLYGGGVCISEFSCLTNQHSKGQMTATCRILSLPFKSCIFTELCIIDHEKFSRAINEKSPSMRGFLRLIQIVTSVLQWVTLDHSRRVLSIQRWRRMCSRSAHVIHSTAIVKAQIIRTCFIFYPSSLHSGPSVKTAPVTDIMLNINAGIVTDNEVSP